MENTFCIPNQAGVIISCLPIQLFKETAVWAEVEVYEFCCKTLLPKANQMILCLNKYK